MQEVFTKREVEILKKICENPIWQEDKHFKVDKPTTLQALLIDICSEYNISEELFLSQRRDAHLVKARKEYVKFAKKNLKFTSLQIAESMNREVSSIQYYTNTPSTKIQKLLDSYEKVKSND